MQDVSAREEDRTPLRVKRVEADGAHCRRIFQRDDLKILQSRQRSLLRPTPAVGKRACDRQPARAAPSSCLSRVHCRRYQRPVRAHHHRRLAATTARPPSRSVQSIPPPLRPRALVAVGSRAQTVRGRPIAVRGEAEHGGWSCPLGESGGM